MSAVYRVISFIVLTCLMNSTLVLADAKFGWKFLVALFGGAFFILYNIFPVGKKQPNFRLRMLCGGTELLMLFLLTGCASLGIGIYGLIQTILRNVPTMRFILYAVIAVLLETVLFINGIVRVYLTSSQLGIRYRVLGLLLGWIPVANLVMLLIIYIKVRKECTAELALAQRDRQREPQQVCATRYPILLVHGVFFRDSRYLNYWGRVPAELAKNGAVIHYGSQQSALSVEDSAAELAQRIKSICEKTGCGKVNIIAHSKGGLDSRFAISKLGCSEYVASLTTVNTPHRGCIFAEYLLGKAPEKLVSTIENTYNEAFRRLGDSNPDFLAAVKNLTGSFCEGFNREVPDASGVMYQSVGSAAKNFRSGRFPLNVSYPVVKKFDGENDGLVAVDSMKWGERFIPLYPTGKRGITHADVIDLNREDFKGFDVREFYVGLVSDLKERGF